MCDTERSLVVPLHLYLKQQQQIETLKLQVAELQSQLTLMLLAATPAAAAAAAAVSPSARSREAGDVGGRSPSLAPRRLREVNAAATGTAEHNKKTFSNRLLNKFITIIFYILTTRATLTKMICKLYITPKHHHQYHQLQQQHLQLQQHTARMEQV